ncbi:MAG: hypothetical protein JO108_22655 [Acidobacteriaceae bacterium]|nr:hypothetical protein [Acidobacteriaceae bacterium]
MSRLPNQNNLPSDVRMTFHTDVPPILYQNWVVCHDPNDIGPMSIITPRFLMLKGNESGPRVALRCETRHVLPPLYV